MKQIYYNDGVNPAVCVHTCSSLKEAWRWVNAQISGYKIVDPYASCSEDIMKSSKTAFYEVFEGEPISVSEDGEPTLVDPVFSSPHFYTVWNIQPYRITVKRNFMQKDSFTYDVFFDDDNNTNSKGWHESYKYCKDYIDMYNGTNESYFEDYKGGFVSIYCNETGEEVYSERIKWHRSNNN